MSTKPNNSATKGISPWAYIPLLYFMQALPVTLVQDVSQIVYKDLGIANEQIVIWTSLIALPWSLQMLFGPLVDLQSTKRRWTLVGQGLIAATLVIYPLVLGLPNGFQISLAVFFVTAIFSVLCNVATDGFYILSLSKENQAAFAGIQTTSYRLGTLFGKSLLVLIAGVLAERYGFAKVPAWIVALLFGAAVYGLGWLLNGKVMPKPPLDQPQTSDSSPERKNLISQTLAIVGLGLTLYFCCSSVVKLCAQLIWKLADGSPTGKLHGWMLPPTASFFGVSTALNSEIAELLQLIICGVLSVLLVRFVRQRVLKGPMGDAFVSYFQQPRIGWILAFLMLYRFSEAMVTKMSLLFFKDSRQNGGLGLDNEKVGIIAGVVVFGLVLGGLLGGWVVSKFGLKRSILVLAICMHLPNLLYLWASIVKPGFLPVSGIYFAEQFGYGFGFAGYMIVQMAIANKNHYQTSHYAMGVGIGALFIQVAGLFSGIVEGNFGYVPFFAIASFMAIPGIITLFFLPLENAKAGAVG